VPPTGRSLLDRLFEIQLVDQTSSRL
jgi:hypothetical protein